MTLQDVMEEISKAYCQEDVDYAWEKYEQYLAYHEQDWKEEYYRRKYEDSI